MDSFVWNVAGDTTDIPHWIMALFVNKQKYHQPTEGIFMGRLIIAISGYIIVLVRQIFGRNLLSEALVGNS